MTGHRSLTAACAGPTSSSRPAGFRVRRVRLLAALLAFSPPALVLADARAPALLAIAPFALVLADARPPALLAIAPPALMLADARPPALLAIAPSPLVRADAEPPLAFAPPALVLADARPPALLAFAPPALVLADARAPALLAIAEGTDARAARRRTFRPAWRSSREEFIFNKNKPLLKINVFVYTFFTLRAYCSSLSMNLR